MINQKLLEVVQRKFRYGFVAHLDEVQEELLYFPGVGVGIGVGS